MSEIKKLIERLCPDGVEYKKLGEVIISLKTGLNPRKNFVLNEPGSNRPYITGKDIFNNRINVSDKTDLITDDALKLINKRACLENGLLLFASTGTGTVGRMAIIENYKNDWAMSETLYAIKTKEQLLPKFLMYYLYSENSRNQFEPKISKGSVPHLKVSDLQNVLLPVPPIEEQSKIVEILDHFTELEAELEIKLEAELEARRKQYEYYRNQLLTFDKVGGARFDVKWMKLGDICDTLSGFPFDSSKFKDEGIQLMRGANIKRGYFDFSSELNKYWESSEGLEKYLLEPNDIIISMDGSLVGKSFCYLKEEHLPLLLVQRVARLRTKENFKYIYYNITKSFSDYVDKKKTAGAIPHISMKDINGFTIPLPPLKEQNRIVSILDRFESLTNDLQSGLPAEIEARRKQYEYYREKLLTFKRKTA